MATKLTVTQNVLKTLSTRKGGFTDKELIEKTGCPYAHTVRSKLTKTGQVIQLGSKKDKATNRTVKTYVAA